MAFYYINLETLFTLYGHVMSNITSFYTYHFVNIIFTRYVYFFFIDIVFYSNRFSARWVTSFDYHSHTTLPHVRCVKHKCFNTWELFS